MGADDRTLEIREIIEAADRERPERTVRVPISAEKELEFTVLFLTPATLADLVERTRGEWREDATGPERLEAVEAHAAAVLPEVLAAPGSESPVFAEAQDTFAILWRNPYARYVLFGVYTDLMRDYGRMVSGNSRRRRTAQTDNAQL